MKSVLVTGSNGFLGTNLCSKLLAEGNLVIGISRTERNRIEHPNFKFIKRDIRENLSDIECDEIYHLAGVATLSEFNRDSFDVADTIISGTQNVLILAAKNKAKFIFASSVGADHLGPVENIRSCYDDTKRGMEAFIYHFSKARGFEAKVLRIPSVYGPYMKIEESRVVSNFIKDVIKKGVPILYGDISSERSYCYVEDFIEDALNIAENSETFLNEIPSSFIISTENLASLIQGVVLYDLTDDYGFMKTAKYIKERI